MKIGLAVLLLVLVVAAGAKYVGTRNGLVAEREDIAADWAQVDAALQQRAELVPEFIQAVRGKASGEHSAIDAVLQARADLEKVRGPERKIRANSRLDTAIGRLLLAVENYPELDHSKKLAVLEDGLKQAEDRIAVERRKYNEALQRYNTSISLFPDNLVASLSGFARNDAYFKTEPGARTAPKVQF